MTRSRVLHSSAVLLATAALLAAAWWADGYARRGLSVRYEALIEEPVEEPPQESVEESAEETRGEAGQEALGARLGARPGTQEPPRVERASPSNDTATRERYVEVLRTVEHRIQHPNEHRALSRYVQSWDYASLGVPDEMPRFRITMWGRLHVDGPGSIHLRARPHSGEAELFVDGERDPEWVSPGEHDVRVEWSGRFEEKRDRTPMQTSLLLQQSVDGRSWEDVDSADTRPAWTDEGDVAIVWTAAALAWLLLVLPLALILFGDPARRRRRLGWLALAGILTLGLGYRLWDYHVMPQFQENGDELFAVWNGYSLLTEGETRGWTFWSPYYGGGVERSELVYWMQTNGRWQIIQPYFEHPPLAHVMVGAAAWLGGAEHWSHGRQKHTRLVPIALSVLIMGLMFLVGRELDQRQSLAPWLGVLLYAALPLFVINNRAIKEEMVVVPLELLSMWLFLRWRRGVRADAPRDALIVLAGLSAGLAVLAKIPSGVFVPALVLLVMTTGRWKSAVKVGLAGLVGIALLLTYGAVMDWQQFTLTTFKQATGRPAHWNIFPRFFADGMLVHNITFHAHQLFLWLAALTHFGGRGRRVDPAWVVFPTCYLIVIAVSSGNWTFGWYMLPVYPFLCLAAGQFLVSLWREPSPLAGLIFMGLLVMYFGNFFETPRAMKSSIHWPRLRTWISAFVLFAIGPYFLATVRRWRWTQTVARAATALGLVLVVGLSGWYVYHYDVLYESHWNFDRDRYFDR